MSAERENIARFSRRTVAVFMCQCYELIWLRPSCHTDALNYWSPNNIRMWSPTFAGGKKRRNWERLMSIPFSLPILTLPLSGPSPITRILAGFWNCKESFPLSRVNFPFLFHHLETQSFSCETHKKMTSESQHFPPMFSSGANLQI